MSDQKKVPGRCDIVQPLDDKVLELITQINKHIASMPPDLRVHFTHATRMATSDSPLECLRKMCCVLGLSIATSVAVASAEKAREIAKGN